MPPSISVGATRFGTAVGGGIGFQFSDMLRNHGLLANVQLQSGVGGDYRFKNTSGELADINDASRWGWD